MNSPDRASGGSPSVDPEGVVAASKSAGDRKSPPNASPGPANGGKRGSSGTASTAPSRSSPSSFLGRNPSSGSSDGAGGQGQRRESRNPSPRSAAVDPSSAERAEAAAGGSGRPRSSRQGGSGSRRSHRRSASDGDPDAATAALDEKRRQRMLKTRQFQSQQGVVGGSYRGLEGGHDSQQQGGGYGHGHAASNPSVAPTSADAAAVGFDPGVMTSQGRSKGASKGKHHRHRGSRHHSHRRTHTMPELPTHEEGRPSPAAHPAVIAQAQAQAQAQLMASQQAGYDQYNAQMAQYYPQPQQLFQHPGGQGQHSPQSQAQLAQGRVPGVPTLQDAPTTPTRKSSRSSKKERRRRQNQHSDPSGSLFGGGGPQLPPMSPASAGSGGFGAGGGGFGIPAPPLTPTAPGSAQIPPRPRNRSNSYSVGDVQQAQAGAGGPVQPQMGERFSARTEFFALSKSKQQQPYSNSQRRLMEGLGVDGAGGSEAPLSPHRRQNFAAAGKAQSWAARGAPPPPIPTSPRRQHQVIGSLPPPQSPHRPQANRRAHSFDVGIGGMRGLSPLTEHVTLSKRDLQVPHVPVAPMLQDNGAGGEGAPLLSGGEHLVYSAPDGSDGNEPFLQESFGSASPRRASSQHTNRRQQSSRKMHMRQHSINLYMEDVRGFVQPKRCRDALFAVLFYAQLAAMVAVGVRFGPEAIRAEDSSSAAAGGGDVDEMIAEGSPHVEEGLEEGAGLHVTYRNVFLVACMCGAFAAALSALALVVMTLIARRLVQVALVFSIGMAFAWGTIGIGLSPKSFVPITGIIALALTVGYAFVVWDRIPFAAANLRTALSGIKSNLGAVAVAFLFQALALGWSIYYTFAVIGLYDAIENGDLNVGGDGAKVCVYVGLGFSYYWTFQVIVHTVQSTVAGAVGEWWYLPASDTTFCSPATSASFTRSTVQSFGSICLGSLLVGPVQILRQVAENFRPNPEGATILSCVAQCMSGVMGCAVGCVDRLAEIYHPWAFTYVGMYGYGFVDAGRHATDLFRKRGWTTIVTDDLIPNVLFIASLVIGGVTGCFGLLVEALDEYGFTSLNRPVITAFLIGSAVGIVLSSVLFSIISAGVHAVVVCFAGSPVEFQQNHPELSHDMRTAWREVWPGCMDILDMKIGMGVGVPSPAMVGLPLPGAGDMPGGGGGSIV